jgi:hypothetical protein
LIARRNVDHRSGPEEFVDLEIGERRKDLTKVPKCRVMKGVGPWSTVCGHIEEGSLAQRASNVGVEVEKR